MSMINARGTTNGSAYAMWSVMLYGTCKQTDHGCTSCPTSMLSLRSQPLSSALLLKNKPREQHECTNLMHSDLVERFVNSLQVISASAPLPWLQLGGLAPTAWLN